MQITRLNLQGKPESGGILFILPNNSQKQVTWVSKTPVTQVLEFGKACAAALLDHLMAHGLVDIADRTNWPSVTAACCHHIRGFNAALAKAQLGNQTLN